MEMVQDMDSWHFPKMIQDSILESWLMGSWKYLRYEVARALKVPSKAKGCSTYHFAVGQVKVRSNILSRIVSSIILFDERHWWKFITWFLGSSAWFPLNFGMSEGSFVGMGGQFGFCAMGSFIIFDRSGKFKDAKKGNGVLSAILNFENTGLWLSIGDRKSVV